MTDFESQLDGLGAGGTLAAGSVLQTPASQFGNDLSLEYLWAANAHCYADMHMKLMKFIDPGTVKLTKFDDYIHRLFMRYFKHLNIEVLNENELKSEDAKARWRPFCEHFKDALDKYNFGTLVRKDCKETYSEENSLFVTRIQFLAIEIARNKKGLNRFHITDSCMENKDTGITEQMNNLSTDGNVER